MESEKDGEEWFNDFTWSIHCNFNHLLNKTGLEGSFLNTLTNKLSVFKQQLLHTKKKRGKKKKGNWLI